MEYNHLTILIVEDDAAISMGLEFALQQEGYRTLTCNSLREGLELLESDDFSQVDLCLLDIGLPDGSGYQLCQAVKGQREVPVIFLTACDAEVNVVMGLDMGADDYVTKPFRLRELTSRIRSVLRRCTAAASNAAAGTTSTAASNAAAGTASTAASHSSEVAPLSASTAAADCGVITWQHLRLYPDQMKVISLADQEGEPANPREIQLTALEYRLLLMFVRHRGQVLSRNQLLESIWDVAGDFVNDNTVSVYIKRLREKLEKNPQRPQLIETVRGVGYRACGKAFEDV